MSARAHLILSQLAPRASPVCKATPQSERRRTMRWEPWPTKADVNFLFLSPVEDIKKDNSFFLSTAREIVTRERSESEINLRKKICHTIKIRFS